MITEVGTNGGDQITGKWINTTTGQVVFARQLINDGDIAQVITDVGIIPMTEFVNYVQMGDEDVQQISLNDNVAITNNNMISADDNALINSAMKEKTQHKPSLTDVFVPSQQKQSKIEIEVESPNFKLIDKLFNKFNDKTPKLDISINWNDFPKEQITTLIEIFDVPKDEIIQYLIDKLLDKESLKETLNEIL